MKLRNKSILTTGLAVALAAAMLVGGGTFAYLQSSTGDVVNAFSSNQVMVNLAETTGSEYHIIPGTEEAKDPKVTVNTTVPAYVYVEVTDTTDGLVGYDVAEGWTLLGSFDNIYYREVAASSTAQEFSVLAGDKVSYDATLGNGDMVDENGALKEGLSLTFQAHAVQKEPFGDPLKAFYQSDTTAATLSDLSEAIENAEDNAAIVITADIMADADNTLVIPQGKTITLALAGHTVTGSASAPAIKVEKDAVLNMSDGTIVAAAGQAGIENEGTATLDSLTVTRDAESVSNEYYAVVNHGTMTLEEGVRVDAPHAGSSLVENGYVDGSGQTEPVKLVINGGSYIGGLNPVKNDDWGVLEINGGYFESGAGNQYCVVNYNDLTINGGTFVSDYRVVWNGNLNDTYNKGQVVVTGGDFTAKQAYMFYNKFDEELGGGASTTEKGFMIFSGGTFKGDDTNESIMFAGPNGWKCADGYEWVANYSDGTCSVVPE